MAEAAFRATHIYTVAFWHAHLSRMRVDWTNVGTDGVHHHPLSSGTLQQVREWRNAQEVRRSVAKELRIRPACVSVLTVGRGFGVQTQSNAEVGNAP